MSITTTIGEVSSAVPPNASQTVAIVGYASGATVNTGYSFNSPGAIQAAIGDGPACMLAVACSKLSGRKVVVIAPTTTGGSLGTVTESPSGTGPTVTVSGTPRYSFSAVKVKSTKAGAGGVGRFKVALDGYTYGDEIDIPAPTQATIVGTVDLTGLTLSTLNTTTLKLDEDTTTLQTVTFTTPTNVQDIADQINSGTTNITASIRSGKYLVIVSDTIGSSSTLSVDATSTADTILGVSGSATGASGTYTIPNTGITVTFPATSDYVLDTVYSFAAFAPTFSTSALSTALAALTASGETYGVIVLAQSGADAYEARQFADQLGADITTGQAVKVYPVGLLGTPVFQADGVTAETEARTKLAFTGHTNADLAVSFGDIYMNGGGSDTGIPGSLRVPISWYAAALAATYRYSSDLGNGQYPPLTSVFSHVGPDGSTLARDERTASTAMEPQRFVVLETRPQNATPGPWIKVGRSRASLASRYKQLRLRRVAYRGVEIAQGVLAGYEQADFDVKADGTLATKDQKAVEGAIAKSIKTDMIDPNPRHLAGVSVALDSSEVVTSTGNLTVAVDLLGKAQAENITLTVNAVGALLSE